MLPQVARAKAAVAIALLASACGSPPAHGDASFGVDAGAPAHDAGAVDASRVDAGPIDPAYDPTGLPCDVARVIGEHCTICHTRPLAGDAPFPLVTHEDLVADLIAGQPSSQVAGIALGEMQSGAMPPGPAPRVPAADVQIVADWVSAGAPAGTTQCASTSPYEGTTTCTSGAHWTMGEVASPLMHPGTGCLGCHAASATPPVPAGTLAGTVYASVHEPDDCDGVAGTDGDPIVVSVVDHDGHTISATVNAAGNFYATDPVALPIASATVTYQGRTRAMASAQPSADCNTCHTETGLSGAPGRIVLP